ncbi:hypothetical protein KIW84_011261 [Lathyrus oleraceus]|uniref:Uncharacterized protein n=1 Tax=Pisum sativum TaxID=3888 RepID=A0A9D4YM42_PEA|nr:hypothetical protein KIW84_011261 [Pisum sativum]
MSREELFFIFSIFQSKPINSAAFLLAILARVSNQKIENIYVSGIVTHIDITLGLCNQVAHLTHWCEYELIDTYHCLNSRLVRREETTEYNIVILSDVVNQSTLPSPEKTNVHNCDNWHYPIEIQDESPTPPPTPPPYEYHPTPSSDSFSSSSDGSAPFGEHRTELQTIQTNLTTLRTNLTILRCDFMNNTDVMAEQMDNIYQEIYTIRRFLRPDMEHIRARALDLHTELATLDPLPMLSLYIDVCHHMRLIKNESDGRFSLMIANKVVPSIILPCPIRTDVRVRENWTYNLNVSVEAGPVPMDIHQNVVVDGDTNDEFDQRERGSHVHQSPSYHPPHIPASPAHTTHFFDHFAGTSSGATHAILDDILNEMLPRMPPTLRETT